eukprot:s2180_g3.t4
MERCNLPVQGLSEVSFPQLQLLHPWVTEAIVRSCTAEPNIGEMLCKELSLVFGVGLNGLRLGLARAASRSARRHPPALGCPGPGDGLVSDDVQTRLPWKKARDEMIWAVNSLPEKGRKVHQRTVVAKLPDVMAKLAGRAPQHVARKDCAPRGKESEFAAVCFPRETVKELDMPSGPSFSKPPTLEGATPSASISHSFSMGSFFVDFDGDLVARPSSPYQLSFFLPERNTSSEEDKQQQIRGVLEARNPVGFPCHVNAGDDFFCTAASMQLLGSRKLKTSVRVNGVTIFRAAEILFALATLCPERSFMSVRASERLCWDVFDTSLALKGGSRSSSPEHLLAVKILGWEISLLGDERGEGGGVVADEALEAIQEVRASIKAAMARSDEYMVEDLSRPQHREFDNLTRRVCSDSSTGPYNAGQEDNETMKRKLRPSRYEDTPEKILDKLLAVVQEASERLSFSIDHQMRMHAVDNGGQLMMLMAVGYFTLFRFLRACLALFSGLAELIALILALDGTESGFVDFLRPLEFCKDPAVAAARSLKRTCQAADFSDLALWLEVPMLYSLAAGLSLWSAQAHEREPSTTRSRSPSTTSRSSRSSGCGVHRRCSSLEPGEWLAPDEWLTSPSDRYIAVLIADQLQVLDSASLRTRWASPNTKSEELLSVRVAEGHLQLNVPRGAFMQKLPRLRNIRVRFTVTATRGGGDAKSPQGVQLAEFLLWRAGKPMQPTASHASCPDGVGPAYQGPRNAVDGNHKTKWWVSSEPNVTLVLDFPDIPPEGPFLFGFTTGDDMPSRDPVRWILEGSVDGTSWIELHRQDTTFATPLSRASMTQLFDLSHRFMQLTSNLQSAKLGRIAQAAQPFALELSDQGLLALAPRDSGHREPAGLASESPGLAIC